MTITRVLYDEAGFEEEEIHAVEKTFPAPDERRTVWINVDGVHEATVLERYGRRFGLHPLLWRTSRTPASARSSRDTATTSSWT